MINPDILKKLFPFLNLFVIGLAITKIVLFYNYFGINIVQYLELSESLILFFEDLLFYIVALLLPIIVAAIFIGHQIGALNAESAEKFASEQNFFKRTWLFISIYWSFLFLILLSIFTNKPNVPLIVLTITMFILFQTKFVIKKYYNSDLDATYINIIALLVATVGFEYGELSRQITQIENGRYAGTTLHIKDREAISTDSSLIYIGKTKEFYYLFDKKKENAVIISSGEVDRIDLKNNNKGFWRLLK